MDKKKGIVYTPKYISDRIVSILKPLHNETIFEPSVGHGAFIFSLLEYMEKRVDNLKEYFLNYVYAGDIEEKAVEDLKELLVLFFKKRGITLKKEEIKNFKVGDTLKETNHYDIIFGNPPYVRIQNLNKETINQLREKFKSCEKGNIDIYLAFMEFAYKYSKRSSYIVPNSWLKTKTSKTLRDIIIDRLDYVIDFKEKRVFNEADVYTSIFLIKDKPSKNLTLEIDNEKYLLKKSELDIISIKNNLKYDKKGIIKRYHTPIATLRDKIYIKDLDNDDCIDFYKISKIKTEQEFLNSKQKIIFPYQYENSFEIKEVLREETLNYLLKHKEELLQRDKGKREYEKWYAYGRKQGFSKYDFKNDIIIIPGMIKSNFRFFKIDLQKIKKPFLFSSGLILEVDKKDSLDVVNFLNSDKFKDYLKYNGRAFPGKDENYYKLSVKNLRDIFN